ncbi:hypothetical protein LBMAG42_01200 [Deltaproteobacteria bacterium]|nr:hypothetical protein LBMAG42_01200 [Deltaproteobacteria bacterium]
MLSSLLFLLAACEPTTIASDAKDSGVASGSDLVDLDGDGYLEQVDCNDADAAVNPGADDVPDDGVDQDCDGLDATATTDDADGDGYPDAVDCDDVNPAVNPGAADSPDDGVDQDCDGVDATTSTDDGDGFPATVDCDDTDPLVYPGAPDASGDGVDQDCDGVDNPPSADADGDGHANETYGGDDCDDANPNVFGGADESRGDDVDSDCDGADFGVDALLAGDLVITEIMYDPDAVGDSEGEWFEVYNATGHIVNLEGLVGADDAAYDAADIFTVSSVLLAPVGDRLVFGITSDTAINGGITADYDYAGGGVSLNNSGDDLYLGVPSGRSYLTIDAVVYDEAAGWPLAKGLSIELKDSAATSTANDSASNWCEATSRAGSTTDKGSPGAVSSGC